ncbi:SDR family oxidoreductase [Pseudomonas gingeri]|uniref:SDR family oxidoreductase n=1 Tax=Pseudomonas gingeri TaxID=117681 RepID=UPI0015A21BFA|nr:SDR family NAD(P)-dependent oxidoreductase [Pseudomonas gingeri]NWA04146.1 SDR family NAD(P)-dependent oxidoreductase [Pseudomonas gingeri]NWA17492.1 SDR family NAD(P)-dependent oxidoreductase [Pseudomonas gingeri]NWA56453.1 SDR family NAD(P)-dependent oxidoreductase [Pseudomonas gingeri]NWA97763.1 SDR family NAD(P)-dependent oxidoreductase [Pseudomonas gingeri]NWB05396.1 SDR family NAD(P)-dependent oxidoreductase [Pseudomonas gingeri]
MKLIGRTVLITGGSSGIGFELARQLIEKGNTVIVTGRDQARLDETRQLLPSVHTMQSDARDPEDIHALFLAVTRQFPALDTLVNNAGVMRNIRLAEERALTDLTEEIDINLNGPLRMIQQFLPFLLKQPQGLIVNVSSGLAFVPFPAAPVYSASKAALHAYTQCLRAQLAHSTVTVMELAPPGTETPLFRGEFAKEMHNEKGMDVQLMVKRTIRGIEAGKQEIRPGLSNVLKVASRVAPNLMFGQMIRLSQLNSTPDSGC